VLVIILFKHRRCKTKHESITNSGFENLRYFCPFRYYHEKHSFYIYAFVTNIFCLSKINWTVIFLFSNFSLREIRLFYRDVLLSLSVSTLASNCFGRGAILCGLRCRLSRKRIFFKGGYPSSLTEVFRYSFHFGFFNSDFCFCIEKITS
jgi:hypothetical protein